MLVHRVLETPAARRALAVRDIAAVYRILANAGVPQRRIAELTGQNQSDVSEIHKGRQVVGYEVLLRICNGLGMPRGWMGLAYDEDIEQVDSSEEVDEDVKRRALLAVGSFLLTGSPVLGEILHIPVRPPVPTPLPSKLEASDVSVIRALTSELRTVARTYGGCADMMTGVAHRSLPLMSIPSSEETKADLSSVLAELHTEAGWCCVDSGLHDNARACFATAMDLASDDGYRFATAMRHAGIHMRDAGAYNDDLKACQLGLFKLGELPETPEKAGAAAWLTAESAVAYASMGYPDQAEKAITTAREYHMSNTFDEADMDYTVANVYRRLGRLDVAEPFAASSLRKWPGTSRRDSVLSGIALAAIHVRTGAHDSQALAEKAIQSLAGVRSVRARMSINTLVEALDTRPTTENKELAMMARRVVGQHSV